MADNMSIDQKEQVREATDDSMDSTPEADPGPQQEGTAPASQQKRKGGRKPIYATSEERKQRNRQAQAAFRERRTEYIKQLEETIRVHENNLITLQNAHRTASDECLMLRYKNSLLERVLLEKGIDVQAELRAKTGSPHLGPTHMPQNLTQPPTIQRAIMNRHHQARRSNSSIAPKIEPGVLLQSPQSRPTPSSHASSPTSNSPGFNPNQAGVMTPPTSDFQLQVQQQQQRLQAARALSNNGPTVPGIGNAGMTGNSTLARGQGSSGTAGSVSAPIAAAYSPFQKFQNHYEQLEQEYDAQADMVDDQDAPESGPGPYPEALPPAQIPQQLGQPQMAHAHPVMHAVDNNFQGFSSMLDPFDPAIDLDPFGLSASMQFPTQFSFDTSSMR